MRNRKYKLLLYEILEKAAVGEPEAVNTVSKTISDTSNICPIFKGVSTIIFKTTSKHA